MIKQIQCPLCNKSLATEENEMNALVLSHCREAHPPAAEKISDTIMEIGKLRDKIHRMKKNIKRVTGYHIPNVELSHAMLNGVEAEEVPVKVLR